MINTNAKADIISHIGWRYYNIIKKKAMEQEFSWPGLIISLSIAFFIVLFCAIILNIIHKSVLSAKSPKIEYKKIYRLESSSHLNFKTELNEINIKKLSSIKII